MAENSEHYEHGNTPAAWTAVIIMTVGFGIGAVAVILLNWPLFWIGGVGVVVAGAIVGKVMQMMGLGQPLPAAQEASGVPTTTGDPG
ncbi:MAG: HGxxPAAW family protein [Jiangellaceae bacterium]